MGVFVWRWLKKRNKNNDQKFYFGYFLATVKETAAAYCSSFLVSVDRFK